MAKRKEDLLNIIVIIQLWNTGIMTVYKINVSRIFLNYEEETNLKNMCFFVVTLNALA